LNRSVTAILALLIFTSLGGCQVVNPFAGSSLTITPAHDKADTTTNFSTAIYSFDQQNHLTIVLIEGPVESPKSAATIRLFWRPKTGATPIDKTATNATIRYILFEQQDQSTAAVYSGAGFLNPSTDKSDATFRGKLWQANLRLSDAPEGFKDQLGISEISGHLTAERDDLQTHHLLRQLQQRISQRLGYPRLVQRPVSSSRQAHGL